MVIDNKAWSDSFTAVVRQLYHSSKATVKQLSVLGVARRDSRSNVAIRWKLAERYLDVFSSPFSSRMLCAGTGLGSDFKNA
jgi:hypothetical protein